jgi:uncharacterized membrane protein YcfT
MSMETRVAGRPTDRFVWVDMAKGLCIIAVVCLYAGKAFAHAFDGSSWLEPWAAFARPFRMPDFFLLSGLFLSAVIDRPWRSYLNTKVAHYAYFILLWGSILYLFGALVLHDSPSPSRGLIPFLKLWAWGLVYPDYMLWFIQTLPLFFVATRLLRHVPKLALWLLAAGAMALPFEFGVPPIDHFTAYYVFFLTGHYCARWIFGLADRARAHPLPTALLFGAWCVLNQWAVSTGLTTRPGLQLLFGLAGIAAIVGLSNLLARLRVFGWLAHVGASSIVVYLGFFIPMMLFIRFAAAHRLPVEINTLAALAVGLGVAAPLLVLQLTQQTPLRYLFMRPAWAQLSASSAEQRDSESGGPSPSAPPIAGTTPYEPPAPLRITWKPLDEQLNLESLWRDLVSRSSCSFFLTWPWIGSWLEQLPALSDTHLVLVHSEERIVGAAILVKSKRYVGPIPICDAWYLHAEGDAEGDDGLCIEHNDFLIDRDHGDDVRNAMIEAWSSVATPAAELHMPGLSPVALGAGHDDDDDLRFKDDTKPSAVVDLEAVRRADLDFTSVLSSHARRFVRRSIKEYQTLGPLKVDEAGSVDEALAFLDHLVNLHQAVWARRDVQSAFAEPEIQSFHRRVIERAWAERAVQLLRVQAGATAIGYLYSFLRGGRVYVYQSGFDYALLDKHGRPGLVTHTLAIQYAAARGLNCYDLLAGEAQYKSTLATATEPMTWSVLQMSALRHSALDLVRDVVRP